MELDLTKNEELIDLTQYEAFKRPGAIDDLVSDLHEQERLIACGELICHTEEEVKARFREKIKNAKLQDNLSTRSRKGA